IRFLLPRDAGLTCADSSVEVAPPGYPANLTLKSHNGTPISDSHDLVLQSSGWPSEQEAKEAGERAMVALALALADLGLGSFVGDRGGPRGMFVNGGLELLRERTGQRALNDHFGLTVFETEPAPRFWQFNATGRVGRNMENFSRALGAQIGREMALDQRE